MQMKGGTIRNSKTHKNLKFLNEMGNQRAGHKNRKKGIKVQVSALSCKDDTQFLFVNFLMHPAVLEPLSSP